MRRSRWAADLRKRLSTLDAGFSVSGARADYLRTAGELGPHSPGPLVAAIPEVAGRCVRSRACSIAKRRECALDSPVGDRIIDGEGTEVSSCLATRWPGEDGAPAPHRSRAGAGGAGAFTKYRKF